MSVLDEPKGGKHTVYIDVDDEITAIIEKVKASPDKIVALVLPKRATVLQSIINMKLLKKSAQSAKKSLVLITSESGLMPLAGVVGLHVAKSLQSRPEIPLPPDRYDANESEISEVTSSEEDEPEIDKTKSVGALSAADSVPAPDGEDDTETIELDNVNIESEDIAKPDKKDKKKSGKGFKVPNFDRFRLSFFLTILAVIVLVGGWIMAAVILPKATVVINTDTNTTTSDINFTINTATKDLSLDQAQVPAVQKEVKKTDTEKATATGKKDTGAKATGSVTFYNCSINDKLSDNDRTLAAGTTITSGGLTFVTSSDVVIHPSSYAVNTCQSNKPSVAVGITATKPGTESNLATNSIFSVSSPTSVSATNSNALAGGTPSVIVKVVSQADVDAAAIKMKGRLDTSATTELSQALSTDNLKGLDETKTISEPAITSSPAVGTEVAGEVTVTSVTTYSILGVKSDFLSQLIKKDIGSRVDLTKGSVLDDGLGAATIHVTTRKSPTEAQMSLHTVVISGAKLDPEAIKNEIRGKKRGDAENIIKAKPGVTDVTISYKPFWVYSTPKSIKKITVTIKKPDVVPATAKDTSNGYKP